MNPTREEALFALASAKPAAERAAWLDRECAGDPALRKRLEALLQAREGSATLPEPPDTSSERTTVGLEFAEVEGPGAKIGRYKLLQKIGEGGMGIVYMAEQEEPVRRRVALKIIKLGMDTRQVVARFEAERQALALMDHPNIARVLDGGATEAGRPYFVMELVQGMPITEFCDQHKLPAQERLKLFVQVCQAVQSAHQKAIIHRDIKPSNVLVTLHHGEPMPKVIDFGIAKATSQKLTEKTLFTNYGAMIGTPAYMSPEQAEMSSLDIDTRSDIYSLGVLLYELLTGSTPFSEKRLRSLAFGEMQRVIAEEEPERPSTRLSTMGDEQRTAVLKNHGEELGSLSKLMKGDLDWIVMKCLEKDRTRRYETANGLAADIRRQMNNEPVVARPPSMAYRFQKAFRRNKAAFAVAVLIAGVLVWATGISVWQAVRATRAESEQARLRVSAEQAGALEAKLREAATAARALAEQESARAKKTAEILRVNAYASDMRAAQVALVEGNLGQCRDLLRRHLPQPDQADLRGAEWRYLWSESHSDSTAEFRHDSFVVQALPLPDLKSLVTLALDGQITVWDIPTRRVIHRLSRSPRLVSFAGSRIALSPDGTRFAVGMTDEVWLYATAGWEPIRKFPGGALSLAFTPDSESLVAAKPDTITFWNLTTGQSNSSASQQLSSNDGFQHIVCSPDGRLMFLNDRKGKSIEVWDLLKQSPVKAVLDAVECVATAVSPDSHWLAGGSSDGSVTLWSLPDVRPMATNQTHPGLTLGLAFSPDSHTLATGGDDQLIKLWNVPNPGQSTGLILRETLKGHDNEIWGLNFSTDGRFLVSCGKDGTARLWPWRELPRKAIRINTAFNNTASLGRMLWSSADAGTLQGWDFRTGRQSVSTPIPTEQTNQRAIEWDSSILYPNLNGDLMRWNPLTQSSEKLLAGVCSNTTLCAVVTNQGRLLVLVSAGNPQRLEAWAPGSTRPCSESWTEGLKGIKEIEERSWDARCLQSPDGRFLAAPGADFSLSLLEWDRPGAIRLLKGHGWHIYAMAFSPDSKLLASGSWDGTARLWNVSDGREPLPPLRGHRSGVHTVQFTADGRTLITAGDDLTIRFWNVRTGQEMMVLEGMDAVSSLSNGQRSCWVMPPDSDDGLLVRLARNRSDPVMFIPIPTLKIIDAEMQRETAIIP